MTGRFVDIIIRKRDGHELSREEIESFVSGVTAGIVPDYQASALLMAIFVRNMTEPETAWLTGAMARSGAHVDLSDVPGIKVGKHSTGGVGDKVSLVLAPLVAACGVPVPKMSGRGLGHTGGTLDKLESIPGLSVDLAIDAFKRVLREVGTSIVGQTDTLAPADKKLYALRDVTATIESIPLISASIMGKKLAEGCDALVLDVKCGNGAFMKDLAGARALAESMVSIGNLAGLRTEAFITDMDAPLGHAVGNALEIREAIETLQGSGPADLLSVVVRLAVRMVVLGGVETDASAAARRVESVLRSGQGLHTFARMIECQGGDARVVDDVSLLPSAPGRERSLSSRDGVVTAMRAGPIGRASNILGAGRSKVGEPIDHAVGALVLVKPGQEVRRGEPLFELHHRDGRGLDAALRLCAHAVDIGDEPPPPREMLLHHVR